MSPTEQYENQLNSRLTLGACATSTVWAAAGTALAPPSICLAAIAAAWASICCNTRQELLGQVLEVTAAVRAERGVNLIASPNSFRS